MVKVVVSTENDSLAISADGPTFIAYCPISGLGDVAVSATETVVLLGIDAIRYKPSEAVPIPVS